MKDHFVLKWILMGALLTEGHSLQPNSSPHKSSRIEWRAAKVGNRKVAVLSRRYDIERDRRSVLRDTDMRDTADMWLHNHSNNYNRDEQRLLGMMSRSMLREEELEATNDPSEVAKEDASHKRRHERKRKRKRRYKNQENKQLRRNRMRKKNVGKRDGVNKNSGSSAIMEGVGKNMEQREERKRGRRRDRKRKKNRKDRKRKRKKGSRNKKKRKEREDRAMKDFPKFENETLLKGNEACQYINLKQCASKADIFKKDNVQDQKKLDNNKCFKRKRFLECMEKEREGQTCTPDMKIQGNILALRNSIRSIIWTVSSCILTEALNG